MESPGFACQASSYSAEVSRRAVFSAYARTAANTPGILAGGLLSATDMQLSAPGSGLSVNISTGEAIVGGSEGGVQGGYYTRNASTTNLAIATANASNPRIDTVCVTIADAGYTEPTGVAGNAAVLQVVTGTATAGATLVNLSGKAALPLSSLLLGYVLVPATATNIITADIANIAAVAVPQLGLAAPRTPMTNVGRVLGTAYQPNLTRPTLVVAGVGSGSVTTGATGQVSVLMDQANPPTTNIGSIGTTQTGATSVSVASTTTFLVPPGYFYKFLTAAGSPSLNTVYEFAL